MSRPNVTVSRPERATPSANHLVAHRSLYCQRPYDAIGSAKRVGRPGLRRPESIKPSAPRATRSAIRQPPRMFRPMTSDSAPSGAPQCRTCGFCWATAGAASASSNGMSRVSARHSAERSRPRLRGTRPSCMSTTIDRLILTERPKAIHRHDAHIVSGLTTRPSEPGDDALLAAAAAMRTAGAWPLRLQPVAVASEVQGSDLLLGLADQVTFGRRTSSPYQRAASPSVPSVQRTTARRLASDPVEGPRTTARRPRPESFARASAATSRSACLRRTAHPSHGARPLGPST